MIAPTTIREIAVLDSRNMIMNGAMAIEQKRPRNSAQLANGDYVIDRWMFSGIDESTFLGEQDKGNVPPPPGFAHCLGISVGRARRSIAGDWSNISQSIEAGRIAPCGFGALDAKPLALSFWVRSSVAGIYSGALSNADSSRSYPFVFEVLRQDNWEQKTVAVPGDTRGNWVLDGSRKAMAIVFNLAAAEPYLGYAGSWVNGNNTGVHGSVTLAEHEGASFYITGVQLEVNAEPTPFEHKPPDEELSLCRRYFEVLGGTGGSVNFGDGFYASADTMVAQVPLLAMKRASPTVLFEGNGFTFVSASGPRAVSSLVVIGAGLSAVLVSGKVRDGQAGEHGYLSNQDDCDSRIIFSADF